ncbi:hypothetical protein [Fibrobacter sp.]|uniref:hypothetical protein n=1 Tax=Fibrobacter sp. TaxID=35828 RepID=UPI003869E7E5
MFKKDFSCVWPVLACLSLISLTACSDDAVSNPRSLAEPVLPTDASGDSVQINIGGFTYTFPACNAESEGTSIKKFIGNSKYGYDRYYKCEKGSWNETSAADVECAQSDVKIGDVCPIRYYGYVGMGGPIRLSCYVYTENGWTNKGSVDFYGEDQKSSCEEVLNAPKIETGCTDGEEPKEIEKDNKVYSYTCSSGEWLVYDVERTESNLKCESLTGGAITRFLVQKEGDRLKNVCSEPIPVIGDEVYAEDCNAENEGRVLSLWSGNPKYGYMSYYRCQKDSWVKGDISLTCDTAGVAVGDTCVKQNSINIFQAGMNPTGEIESFVYKGNGVWTKVETEEIARIAK